MDNKLYKLMNWPEIESVIYSESSNPCKILGMKETPQGYLIQAFFPDCVKVSIKNLQNSSVIPMECVDENGFFAVLIPSKSTFAYEYIVEKADGTIEKRPEVYDYVPKFWGAISDKLDAGILYDSYRYFGGHFCERKGILGTEFMTFAPNAERVSVVGDFNNWDGRMHQMERITDSGVFALFIPKVMEGSLYKFEIKLPNSLTFLKRDPYAKAIEKGENDASAVVSEPNWEMSSKHVVLSENHFSLLNVSMHELFSKYGTKENVFNKISNDISELGYTGVILYDITKCINRCVCDFETVSLYSVDSNVFTKEDIVYIIAGLHNKKVPVIMSLDLASFIPDDSGLNGFDGSSLYGTQDKLINNKYTFNFRSRFLRNYLISVCDYYVQMFSFDGICLGGVDRIMYLSYEKGENEWLPNIYGGNENLDGIEFIKHLNSILHIRHPKIVTIAEDSMVSNNLTLSLEEGGLGFDYKLHELFMTDLCSYMKKNTEDRSKNHSELTYSPVYIYCEKYILSVKNNIYGADESLLSEVFQADKEANLRLMLSYMFMHPGRKNLSLSEIKSADVKKLINELNSLYMAKPFLDSKEDSVDAFEWINAIDSKNSVISFMRGTDTERLFVIANFSDKKLAYETGALPGKYKCIFDSSLGIISEGEALTTVAKKMDGRNASISTTLKPLTLYVFSYSE